MTSYYVISKLNSKNSVGKNNLLKHFTEDDFQFSLVIQTVFLLIVNNNHAKF